MRLPSFSVLPVLPVLPVLAGWLALASCERIIPFEPEDSDPLLVLYATVSPNKQFEAHLSRTVGILDRGEPLVLSDAVVWVEDSLGAVVDTLKAVPGSNGFYRGLRRPEASRPYTVKARWMNVPVASGSAKGFHVGGAFAMDSVGYNPGTGVFGMPYIRYRVAIDDDGVPGVYRLEFYEDGDTAWGQQQIYAGTDDPLVQQPVFGGDFDSFIEFSNALFLGQNRSIEVRVYKWVMGTPTKMKVVKVDEATVRYERSLRNQRNAAGPFTQPVPIFSNVVGGVGLVGGQGHLWVRP